ncbi:arylsulfatase [Pseudoduganella umbonata]|uniref:Arylsulfatase n=1 Tax=Pseudoduganella umbonata TaxID=864828 RepID=A0A4P8HW21_9BURK|nr:arylsulfatase [Pseudoduganella umbonata]MBB3221905.1 arylsulfatase [Pseudoduganella umbonata]QCP14297.1 arylsulfatase [Pseudoduganella umbonata]
MSLSARHGLLAAGALATVLAPLADAATPRPEPAQPLAGTGANAAGKAAPNVIWILLDDVGYGAASAFGGLVETPNLDALAAQGLRYTNFHTTAISSPTRAALLTGRNHHSVEMGLFPETATERPGYTARIPASKGTAAEILRANGYGTFAVGKWHLTPVEEAGPSGPFERWPTGKGFGQYYGFLYGSTDQWHPNLVEGTRPVDDEPRGRHLNELLTDKAIHYIDRHRIDDPARPFFLYFAPGAMHSPHQVAQQWIDKYKGRFDAGWDRYREQVFANQQRLGVVPRDAVLPPRDASVKAWDGLSADEKRLYARYFETFAGFLSYTDAEIGRLVAHLKETGQFDDTIIAVMIGDNGASKEGSGHGSLNGLGVVLNPEAGISRALSAIDRIGGEYSKPNYPLGWAQATNVPFKRWKQDANSEGGTRNPMILSYPAGIRDKGGIRGQYAHVIDMLPTTLELARQPAPERIGGVRQEGFEGTSLAYSVADAKAPSRHVTQYYEINGSRAIYHDGWKAATLHKAGTPFESDVWELYNLAEDPTEARDLAARHPDKLKELQALFEREAKKYNVFPLKDTLYQEYARNRSYWRGQQVVELAPDVGRINAQTAPPINGPYYRLTVPVELPEQGAEGVLVSSGGRFGGSSIFVQDGRLHYAQTNGAQPALVSSNRVLRRGKSQVTVEFDPAASGGAQVRLYQDGELLGEGAVPVRNGFAYLPFGESFDLGQDPHTPVSERYKVPFRFTGTLGKVTIDYRRRAAPPPAANFNAAQQGKS